MGLKIPRSKGRAGSIPASGTKQIKGLHEILHAGPLFLHRKNSSAAQFRSPSRHPAEQMQNPLARFIRNTAWPCAHLIVVRNQAREFALDDRSGKSA